MDQTGMLVTSGLAHYLWPMSDRFQKHLDAEQQLQKQQQPKQKKKMQKQPQNKGSQNHDPQGSQQGPPPSSIQSSSTEPDSSSQVPLSQLFVALQTQAQLIPPAGPANQTLAAIPSGLVVEQPNIAAFQKVEPRTAAALVYNRDVLTWYLVTHAVMAQTTQLRLEQSPNLRAPHEECATARMRQEQKSFGHLSNPEASKIFLFGGVLRFWDLGQMDPQAVNPQ